MQAIRIFIIATVAAVTIFGCKKRDPDPIPPTPSAATADAKAAAGSGHHPGSGIEWFDGDVDAAFARAKAEGKPVFLYWGAEWCPPCHELKASVFSRADFQQKAKLFVPVYLDGDTAGAQKWGDVFHVSGYPTVVILDADRRELTRMSGGMDLSQYAESLDLVLGDVRPVTDTLASLREESRAAVAGRLSSPGLQRLGRHGDGLARCGERARDCRRAVSARGSSRARTSSGERRVSFDVCGFRSAGSRQTAERAHEETRVRDLRRPRRPGGRAGCDGCAAQSG